MHDLFGNPEDRFSCDEAHMISVTRKSVSGVYNKIRLLLFAYWVMLHAFLSLFFLSKSTFSKISFRNTIRMSNSLDPDPARLYVGFDLNPNCLQTLSADDTSRAKS